MSDKKSPSPPLNRRKALEPSGGGGSSTSSTSRASRGGGGSSRSIRGRRGAGGRGGRASGSMPHDHPQHPDNRQEKEQEHHHQQQNSSSSTMSNFVLMDGSGTSGGGGAGAGNFSKNSGDSLDEFSDVENKATPSSGKGNDDEDDHTWSGDSGVGQSSKGGHRGRSSWRHRNRWGPGGASASTFGHRTSNEDEDDEEEEDDEDEKHEVDEEEIEVDENDEMVATDYAQEPLLASGDDRGPSVIPKRSITTVFGGDGDNNGALDRYQHSQGASAASASSQHGGGASAASIAIGGGGGSSGGASSSNAYNPISAHYHHHQQHQQPQHPLHNAAAVARSHAVGVPYNPLHNWQATKHTLKERFSFMFCNEILADVHFVVGRNDQRQRIPAHRFVLSVGSAVFDAMFNGAMAQSQLEDIDLPDVEPAAFLALLKFLYSDDVQIGPESVMTTLYTAKKYAVPALENECVEFLKRALNAENAFMLLTQARLFDEPHLAALCLDVIDKHTNEALNAEGFTDIDMDTLCAVLERDTLRVREKALYQAVVRWSTEECNRRSMGITSENQRAVLGRALQLIRFPLMTVEEFAQTAAQSGILSDREAVNLFLYFTVNPKPSVQFLDVPRCCVTGKERVVNRFQRIEGRWGYSGTPDRIKFNVDQRIYIVGFGLYGSIHGPVEYQVTIQIIQCTTGKVIGSNETAFQCDGSANTFRVLFKEPVEIMASVTYIASACLKGPDSHYGTKGLRRIMQQSSSGSVTFQFTYAAGNNNGTSVEDGQIPEIIYYTKLCT